MGSTEGENDYNIRLRKRAEDLLRGKQIEVDDLRSEDIQYLLHELQVYQAELSIQNDELRRVQLDLEIARDTYSDLFNFAPAGYCTVNRKGLTLEANETLAKLLGVRREALLGAKLSNHVFRDDQDRYYLHQQQAFESGERQTCRLRMTTKSGELIVFQMESQTANNDHHQLLVMVNDVSEQLKIEKEAVEAAVLWELQHRITEQREQERVQITRDLHDGPLQDLIALTYTLHQLALDSPDAAFSQQLKDMGGKMGEVITVLRNYAIMLRPPMMVQFGLEKTMRAFGQRFQEKYPDISLHFEIHDTATILKERMALAMFRIFQEALTNVVRHARSTDTLIVVRLSRNGTTLCLEIEDNGQGFDPPEQLSVLVHQGHLGLIGMRERAESIGGRLEIHSKPGEGTRVTVYAPVEPVEKS